MPLFKCLEWRLMPQRDLKLNRCACELVGKIAGVRQGGDDRFAAPGALPLDVRCLHEGQDGRDGRV